MALTLTLIHILVKNPRGVEKKTWWLEETHAVKLIGLKYQSEDTQTNICFQNMYVLYLYLHLGKTTESYVSISQNLCLLKAPPWSGLQGKISKSRCLLCFKWSTKCYLGKKNLLMLDEIYVSLSKLTIFFQTAVYLWLLSVYCSLSLIHWFWIIV